MRQRNFIAGATFAIAMPRIARAQIADKPKRIAMVHASEMPSNMTAAGRPSFKAFFNELEKQGYVEGRNLEVLRLSGEGRQDQFAAVARRAVDTAPDVIFSMHARLALALKSQTSSIPIVAINSDPVALGLVSNLARPGENITGVSVDAGLEIWGKRIDILSEATGRPAKMHFLTTSQQWGAATGNVIREVATRAGISLVVVQLDGDVDRNNYVQAFNKLKEDTAQALLVSEVAENLSNRNTIVELATQHSLPAIYPYREFIDVGGLLAYAIDLPEALRQIARQIVTIFGGTRPGDIPVFQPTKFQLIANVKAAQAIRLTMPATLLLRADEVIE
jgi:putative ABC transport system substrate-binding protein